MKIAVYLSKQFYSEDTPIYKVKSIKTKKVNEEKIKKEQEYLLIPSSETTLNNMYTDGWKLVSTEQPFVPWMFLFLEKND